MRILLCRGTSLHAACALTVLIGFTTHGAALADGTKGCDQVSLQAGFMMEDATKRVFSDAKFQAITIRAQTPTYMKSSGVERMAKALVFDQRFRVVDPGEGTQRLRLRNLADEDVGWVEREDVICRLLPLTDPKTGLLRRMVIETETAVQGQVVPRTAYHSPDGRCEGGTASCPKLSRFQWYFVYAEEAGHVLLSEAANLGGQNARLVGWLPEAHGIKWNTAVALRPTVELAKRKSKDGTGEAHVCAYPKLEAMNDPSACRPILGGLRWFKLETRLPILRDLDKVYEVAVSSAGSRGTYEQTIALAGIDALKNLDVFFVIDGTKSMQNIIDAIKGRPGFPGVVQQFQERLRGKVRQGGVVRFGYRIYRDSVRGGKTGVEDDGLPLDNKCVANDEIFTRSFQNVAAYDPTEDTDYPENSYGGLIQAALDMASCPDHLKVVFVIGDHGYDAKAQRERGHKAYDDATVIGRYARDVKSGGRLNTQPIVVFIQGPNEAATAKNSTAYTAAYDAFRTQALSILNGIYEPLLASSGKITAKPEEYFFRLSSRDPDHAIIDRIAARVDEWLQPDQIGMLAERLRGGESLKEAIEALQKGDQSNVPILYWNVVADALCKRLGNQCTKKVLEGVSRNYIAHSPDLTHDVLLSQAQLENWRKILSQFSSAWAQIKVGLARTQLVNPLMESLGTVLKIVIHDDGKTMGNFAQLVGGLPYGADSKLMAYTPAELRDDKRLPDCEIQHLVNYANKKASIIDIAFNGDKLAEFTEQTLPVIACALTPKGKAVPHIPGAPRPRLLNPPDSDTDYSISFRKGNDRYYWLPLSYLP